MIIEMVPLECLGGFHLRIPALVKPNACNPGFAHSLRRLDTYYPLLLPWLDRMHVDPDCDHWVRMHGRTRLAPCVQQNSLATIIWLITLR